MKIKKFNKFITEEISGTELVGPVGPAYGETRLQNKTVDASDTTVVFSDLDSKFYSEDEFNELYNNYLKSGGIPLQDGYCKENIDKILDFLQNS
jgi:hypothetical protein